MNNIQNSILFVNVPSFFKQKEESKPKFFFIIYECVDSTRLSGVLLSMYSIVWSFKKHYFNEYTRMLRDKRFFRRHKQ